MIALTRSRREDGVTIGEIRRSASRAAVINASMINPQLSPAAEVLGAQLDLANLRST